MNEVCGSLVLVSYLSYGVLGIVLERRLNQHTVGLIRPLSEAEIESPDGWRLFRINRLWHRLRIPVWLALTIALVSLCRTD